MIKTWLWLKVSKWKWLRRLLEWGARTPPPLQVSFDFSWPTISWSRAARFPVYFSKVTTPAFTRGIGSLRRDFLGYRRYPYPTHFQRNMFNQLFTKERVEQWQTVEGLYIIWKMVSEQNYLTSREAWPLVDVVVPVRGDIVMSITRRTSRKQGVRFIYDLYLKWPEEEHMNLRASSRSAEEIGKAFDKRLLMVKMVYGGGGE